ncbi:MAG: hypothetical protein R3345_05630, partial [Fulvivirga sp.]|nr:hypothetical protein [Fulvivirga sp.]
LIALESNSGGRLAESAPEDDRFCGNFSFTGDKSAGTIVIDFGDGCEDQRGNIRTGKIFIQYQGGRLMPGSTVTTTLEDFTFNNVAVEGTRTLKNISESLEEYPVFQITLTGGSLTWPDGTVATREVDRVRVWVNAPNPINDEHHVTGTATGITRRGVNYSMEVTDTLVYKRSCRLSSRGRIPVAGTKVITTDNRVITIDFGNGDCDKIVDILVDGNQEEVTLD